jgi:hypothetical protein
MELFQNVSNQKHGITSLESKDVCNYHCEKYNEPLIIKEMILFYLKMVRSIVQYQHAIVKMYGRVAVKRRHCGESSFIS